MSDMRKKNSNWEIKTNGDGMTPTADARLAVLMDIRDELQTLNALLTCKNFTSIPFVLLTIEENTRPPKPLKKKPIKKKR